MYDPTRSPGAAGQDQFMRDASPEEPRPTNGASQPRPYSLYPWHRGSGPPRLAPLEKDGGRIVSLGRAPSHAQNGLDLLNGAAARLEPSMFPNNNGARTSFSHSGNDNHAIDPLLMGGSKDSAAEPRNASQTMSIRSMLAAPYDDRPASPDYVPQNSATRTKRPYRRRQSGDHVTEKAKRKKQTVSYFLSSS